MTDSAVQLFALLFGAHVCGDFVLQTAADVRRKREAPVLVKHCAIHALLAVLITLGPMYWQIPVVVFASHAATDFVKARCHPTAMAFLADQLCHLACLALLALLMTRHRDLQLGWGEMLGLGADYTRGVVWIAGLIVAVRAGRFFMTLFVRRYLEELDAVNAAAPPPRGLHAAGKTIGELERLLIFVLVLADQAAAVGFLIAAKSVFRFGELKESTRRMESEYVIIGTLASFAYAMCVALGVRALLRAL